MTQKSPCIPLYKRGKGRGRLASRPYTSLDVIPAALLYHSGRTRRSAPYISVVLAASHIWGRDLHVLGRNELRPYRSAVSVIASTAKQSL